MQVGTTPSRQLSLLSPTAAVEGRTLAGQTDGEIMIIGSDNVRCLKTKDRTLIVPCHRSDSTHCHYSSQTSLKDHRHATPASQPGSAVPLPPPLPPQSYELLPHCIAPLSRHETERQQKVSATESSLPRHSRLLCATAVYFAPPPSPLRHSRLLCATAVSFTPFPSPLRHSRLLCATAVYFAPRPSSSRRLRLLCATAVFFTPSPSPLRHGRLLYAVSVSFAPQSSSLRHGRPRFATTVAYQSVSWSADLVSTTGQLVPPTGADRPSGSKSSQNGERREVLQPRGIQ